MGKGKTQAGTDLYADSLPLHGIQRLGSLRFRASGLIGSIFVCPDGKTLISNNYNGDRAINVWEIASGRAIRSLSGNHEYERIALSLDGKTLASGKEGAIRLLDVATGKEIRRLGGHAKGVVGFAFSTDGRILASGGKDSTIRLWDVVTGIETVKLPVKEEQVSMLAFTPDGKTLISSDHMYYTVHLWDVATRKVRHEVGRPHNVYSFAVSPDGGWLATGHSDGVIVVWEVATGKRVSELRGQHGRVDSLAYSSDGKVLAAGGSDRRWRDSTICLWDTATGKPLRHLKGHKHFINSVAFFKDGKTLVSGSIDTTIRLWNVANGEEIRPLGDPQLEINTICASPDGRTLASAGGDLRRWDIATGRELGRLPGKGAMAFSPDWRTLASVEEGNQRYTVCLWDVASKKMLHQLVDREWSSSMYWNIANSLAFSPDGKRVASRCRYTNFAVWDATTGNRLREFDWDPHHAEAIAFAPDGRTLAALEGSNSERVRVGFWDVGSGKLLFELNEEISRAADSAPGKDEIKWWLSCPRLSFSLDGRMLVATTGAQKTIAIWELASRQPRRRLDGHLDRVTCAVFSPDGRILASASWDDTIRLWDLATGRKLGQLVGHRGRANCLAFSADGKTLLSGGDDTTVMVWDVTGLLPKGGLAADRAKDLETLWSDLAGADGGRAQRAMWTLVDTPSDALLFLRKRLGANSLIDSARLAQLIAELDDDRFQVREAATRELTKLGVSAVPALRRALARKPSLEVCRRIEQILEQADRPDATAERLREVRAIEALEHIGSAEARQLLEDLVKGLPDARLTHEAKAALERMTRRSKPTE